MPSGSSLFLGWTCTVQDEGGLENYGVLSTHDYRVFSTSLRSVPRILLSSLALAQDARRKDCSLVCLSRFVAGFWGNRFIFNYDIPLYSRFRSSRPKSGHRLLMEWDAHSGDVKQEGRELLLQN